MDTLRRLLERARAVGRRIQAAALTALLFLLYVFGLGAARLHASLFHRRLLRPAPPSPTSYWLPATGFGLSEEERRSQS